MKLGAHVGLLALAAIAAAPAALASPVGTPSLLLPAVQLGIGSVLRNLEFLADGTIRACDGSVRSCDGSVIPSTGWVLGDGSVRLRSPIVMFGDGSVRAGDGSVIPTGQDGVAQDALALRQLGFSANPFIQGAVSVTDNGTPTNFLVTFGGPLSLGATNFTYALTGSATLTDATGDGVSMTAQSLLGLPTAGLIAGGIDGVGVAVTGSTLTGSGTTVLPTASGVGNCVACAVQVLAMAISGSGFGDQYAVTGTFDITEPTSVPAPAPLGLLATGLVLLGLVRRRG
ncbi:MAG: hypothetical protein MUC89_23555 [Acetobacteraceae bacterium]|nr:hypothetical protein [Acetobacteraceae bacterium]